MKRSEMIQILITGLEELDDVDGVNCDKLLSRLLDAGMAPPEVTEPVKTSVMVATPLGWQEQVVEDSKVFVRKWEEE